MSQSRARMFRPHETVQYAEEGIAMELVLPNHSGAENLWFARFTADPGTKVPPHYHTSDTIAVLLQGRAAFAAGDALDERLEMVPGDYLFVPRGLVHTEETLGDERADFILARDGRGGDTIYLDG